MARLLCWKRNVKAACRRFERKRVTVARRWKLSDPSAEVPGPRLRYVTSYSFRDEVHQPHPATFLPACRHSSPTNPWSTSHHTFITLPEASSASQTRLLWPTVRQLRCSIYDKPARSTVLEISSSLCHQKSHLLVRRKLMERLQDGIGEVLGTASPLWPSACYR